MGKRGNGEGSISRRQDGRWEAAGYAPMVGGGRKRIRFYGTSREEVKDKLIAALEQARRNIPVPGATWTVESYLAYWMRTVVPVKTRPRTIELYEATVRLFIVPHIGKIPLAKLSVQDVQQLVTRLQAEGHSIRTLHRMRTVLSSALGRAVKEELVYRNVAHLIDLPQYERKPITPWTGEQAREFLEAARGHRWEIGYQLLLTYGMRRGEVLGLRWSDVDFERSVIHVRQQLQRIDHVLTVGPVKTSAGRRDLPLLPHLRQLLLGRLASLSTAPDEQTFVLLSATGAPVDPKTFVQAFQKIGRDIGLPRITVHHTRHTAATLLKNLGAPVRDVQLILGHANITTTQEIYQHGDVAGQRQALEGAARVLLGDGTAVQGEVLPATRCRQTLPSKASEAIEAEVLQATKNRRSTGVDAAAFRGGPGETRTLDTLLKSLMFAEVDELPTPVIRAVRRRTQRHIMGRVAVNFAVKMSGRHTLPEAREVMATSDRHTLPDEQGVAALADLRALAHACDAALTAKLQRASFPLNLIRPMPPTDPKESRS